MIKIDRVLKKENGWIVSLTSSENLSQDLKFRSFRSECEKFCFSKISLTNRLQLTENKSVYIPYLYNKLRLRGVVSSLIKSINNRNYKFLYKIIKKTEQKRGISNISPTKSLKFNGSSVAVVTHSMRRLGAELLALNIAKTLYENGYNVITLSKTGGGLEHEFWRYSSEVINLEEKSLDYSLKRLKQSSCSGAICNTVVTGDVSLFLSAHDIDVIALIHELPEAIQTLKAEELLIDQYRYSVKMVFPANYVKTMVMKKFNLPVNEDVLVQPQGLYIKTEKLPYDTAFYEVSKKIKVETKRITLLGVGNTTKRKGFDVFIEIAKKLPHFQFVWVGRKEESFYKRSVRGAPSNFIYAGEQFDLSPFYSVSSLLLMTSREDPFPSVVLEAASIGVCTVGFKDGGGFSDFLPDNLLVSTLDPHAFAEKCTTLLSEPRKLTEIGKNLQRRVAEKHSYYNYVMKLLSLFKEERK